MESRNPPPAPPRPHKNERKAATHQSSLTDYFKKSSNPGGKAAQKPAAPALPAAPAAPAAAPVPVPVIMPALSPVPARAPSPNPATRPTASRTPTQTQPWDDGDQAVPDSGRQNRIRQAEGIIQAIRDKVYVTPEGHKHPLGQPNRFLELQTKYYPPGNRVLQDWISSPSQTKLQPGKQTRLHFEPRSTLAAARDWGTVTKPDKSQCKVGVLNFASATRPGGGFRSGAQAQEESLARASNLIYSLESPEGEQFYKLHAKNRDGGRGGFYTHAMIFSGSVTLMRDDSGRFTDPVTVDMLTSAAVNAGDVRRKSSTTGKSRREVEALIEVEMRERMGRILRLFEERGDEVLVLGSFGTGVFQNSIPMVAGLWAELLGPGGRFHGVFDHVEFAILGDATFRQFCDSFKEIEGVMAASRGLSHISVDEAR